jgi:hypothetical protein
VSCVMVRISFCFFSILESEAWAITASKQTAAAMRLCVRVVSWSCPLYVNAAHFFLQTARWFARQWNGVQPHLMLKRWDFNAYWQH